MSLSYLTMNSIEPIWENAVELADTWFARPQSSGDSHIAQMRGKALLAALIYRVLNGRNNDKSLHQVRALLDEEMAEKGAVLIALARDPLQKVRDVALASLALRDNWYCDAVLFLSMNLSDERAGFYARDWLATVLRLSAWTEL